MNIDAIPVELRNVAQWVAWRLEIRHGVQTKVPVNPRSLRAAATNDHRTWSTFHRAMKAVGRRGIVGVGFVLRASDPYCGIDLDGCIGEGGELNAEAELLIKRFNTYSEISPSGKGVKMILRGKKPANSGCQKKLVFGCKQIEVYERERFFTITGTSLSAPKVADDAQAALISLCNSLWPPIRLRPFRFPANIDEVVRERRCLAYVAKCCPPAVSGQMGHAATLRVACETFRFGLSADAAMRVMFAFNATKCIPPWTERELRHKISDAMKKVMASGEMGRRLAVRAG